MVAPKEPSTYSLQHASASEAESNRLDILNNAFVQYFDGNISPISFEDQSPSSILDLGCGNGAWAISAAKAFPQSKVTAVDLLPLPSRTLPPNMVFQQCDISHSLPFPPASFDLVHLRLVLFHVPKADEVLSRIFKLIKPGGWLFIEDVAGQRRLDGEVAYGPAIGIIASSILALASRRGATTDIMLNIQSIIEQSRLFDTVNVRRISIPYQSSRCKDIKMKCLADAWQTTTAIVAREVFVKMYEHEGFTREIGDYGIAELYSDSPEELSMDFAFACARVRSLHGVAKL